MSLSLYNSLSKKKETFKPIKVNEVRMYSCGPTVYDYAHIGNFRTFLSSDVLKRSLIFLGYKIRHVMNITDVDDKTINRSRKEKVKLNELTRKYEKIFFDDLSELNIIKPEILRATESIDEMIKMIELLLNNRYAYKSNDGVYFSISKFEDYGKLAQLEKIKNTKQRIKSDEYDKNNSQDFALWKFHTKEDGEVFWEAPFGKGRPGWHIECSAMSTKSLGIPFDIHTGGIDLIFPHHTNEIAQSECCYGKKFVNFWFHGGFLSVPEGKMSKSLGNIMTLKNIKENGFKPLAYRYFCLTAHYRSQLQFSIENLKAAQTTYERLKNISLELKDDKKENKEYLDKFKEAIEDDLNMPKALSVVWEMVRDENSEGKYKSLKKMDEVLGLELFKKEKIKIPKEIMKLVNEREKARQEKNWKKSDELRDKINELGYQIDDTSEGTKIKKI
jgi:cysteinyl-tRNA synthetase